MRSPTSGRSRGPATGCTPTVGSATSPLDLAIVASDATPPHASVRLLAPDQAVELQLPDWRSARPAQLMTVTGDGATSAPTLFESAHRAAWRRLLHHVGTGTLTEDLAHWQVDTATAARAAALR